jgi:hypothetical protein
MRSEEFLPELAAPTNEITVAVQLCTTMKNLPLFYRRFNTQLKSNDLLIKVTAEQQPAMATATMATIQANVLKQLNISHATFTTMNNPVKVTTGSNSAYIFIPGSATVPFWSPVIKDIGSARVKLPGMSEYSDPRNVPSNVVNFLKNTELAASTYKHSWPPKTGHEIIFDCDFYYLLNLQAFFNSLGNEFKGAVNQNPHPIKGLFKTGASVPEYNQDIFSKLRTYNDVAKYLGAYLQQQSRAPAQGQQ